MQSILNSLPLGKRSTFPLWYNNNSMKLFKHFYLFFLYSKKVGKKYFLDLESSTNKLCKRKYFQYSFDFYCKHIFLMIFNFIVKYSYNNFSAKKFLDNIYNTRNYFFQLFNFIGFF